jgi:hypothetical protein
VYHVDYHRLHYDMTAPSHTDYLSNSWGAPEFTIYHLPVESELHGLPLLCIYLYLIIGLSTGYLGYRLGCLQQVAGRRSPGFLSSSTQDVKLERAHCKIESNPVLRIRPCAIITHQAPIRPTFLNNSIILRGLSQSRIRIFSIPDPNFFHPGSASKNLSILTQKTVSKL